MLIQRFWVVIVGAGLATACGESGDARAAGAPAGVAMAATAGGAMLRPGLYHVVQTGDVEIEEERCLKAADLAAGRFVPADEIQPGWVVDANRLSAGTIDVAARHPKGSGRMRMAGRYTADSFTVDATLEMPIEGEPHSVRTSAQGTFLAALCQGAED